MTIHISPTILQVGTVLCSMVSNGAYTQVLV